MLDMRPGICTFGLYRDFNDFEMNLIHCNIEDFAIQFDTLSGLA